MSRRSAGWTAVLLIAALALVSIGAAGAAPKGDLTVTLGTASGEFDPSQDVIVTVTITNETGRTVRILRWLTPVDGVEEPLFTVTRDGQPVAYTGPHAKRPQATGRDYVSVKSGESITRAVDLGESYDLTGTGQYEVAFNVSAYGLLDEKKSNVQALVSSAISLKVGGRAAKGGKPTPPPPPAPGGTSFNACSTTQQSVLAAARNAAKTYASGALGYLNAGTTGSRYTTWFGIVETTRYDTVRSNFEKISGRMADAGITFDCSSKRNVYAYVYPNAPYTIYLGRVYWNAPATGTDSQAGTLIHEMSHFTVVAGTDDVVYGQAGAMNLASTDPASAIRNADSHEYFAENTPARS